MKHHHIIRWLTALLLLMQTPVRAITIDGDLNDWIATPQGKAGDWQPLRNTTSSTIEDQNTNYLNPGYGGQNYDAEAIYVELDSGTLYVAIVTGLGPYSSKWPAGDIAIDFGDDDSFEYGIVVLGDMSNPRGGLGSAGEIYQVTEWNYGLWTAPDNHDPSGSSSYKSAHPATVKSGEHKGTARMVYQKALYNDNEITQLGKFAGDHYVIETAIDVSVFDPSLWGQKFNVHWTMACANDWIEVDPVPEPPVAFLFGAGLGLLGWSRYQGRSRAHRS
ncbi:hypothetical protein MIT9_P1910 [Methylomarinovum caldicuralii]|uniref:PEP-CTERM protein-sorting domain-containing protein n=1 Tax=Methylomarinovum caldicuralii TaxID=438856 RepID=A0AAU9CCM0_9GAMM|nr:hypothetical protein [Methylomarinovum caldicuralii]BCX82324.1 hypothetical protein MIT9_P1910 [Methylomarinovum caldicuralii]